MPADASAGGSGSDSEAPGSISVTITMPRSSEITDAMTNQANVRRPTRPSDAVFPMWAMPTTSVENTSGAMIILISRRKTSVTIEK